MRVLVRAPFNPYSGYGNDGLGLVRTLLNSGIDVSIDPTWVSPPIPEEIARLLTRRIQGPFDLMIHHVDPLNLSMTEATRKLVSIAVGWTMWEYETLDNLAGRRGMRKNLAGYDRVFGYDSVSAQALSRYVPDAKLGVLQGGFWPQEWPQVARDWTGDRFGFCMVGALHERKDPFVAIEAFRELKADKPDEFAGAELHLKTNIRSLHPAMEQWIPKLRVHYDVWTDDVLREFYASQHVLLAPSRGEGKNLPALEFQATGGAVIATNWGGHTQWLSRDYAYPLDYTLAPVRPSLPECRNARASKDHLKQLMWHVYTHREEVRRKAELAAQIIPRMCHWDAVVERLFTQIGNEIPGGDRLAAEYQRSREATQGRRG